MAESLGADAGAGLKALGVNCTLKKSPDTSHTEALMNRVLEILGEHCVETEILRPVDFNVKFGVTSDEGDGDEWPQILDKIKAADILLIGMSIWFGVRSSVCQMVIERLDGTYNETNEVGQYPLYNKVAGVVVTGNEDGAHSSAETTLFNMTHLGCVVPPNADTYWVGDAGPSLHAADELLVRAQSAPHGADPARDTDPADREHAGRARWRLRARGLIVRVNQVSLRSPRRRCRTSSGW
jgi:multimeric flavodoxin WrbA